LDFGLCLGNESIEVDVLCHSSSTNVTGGSFLDHKPKTKKQRSKTQSVKFMKLRIKGNTIRLRLTQSEVATIGDGGSVKETTIFSPTSQFEYEVQAREVAVVESEYQNNRMLISIPTATAKAWAISNDVGIESEQQPLKIIIEKDFACLSPRGEEDSDTFEHPMTGQTIC
jgi:hypothetical protein